MFPVYGGKCLPRKDPVFQGLESEEYDFVVVGAGIAGSVVASRLSENPDWKVLLIEAGPEEPTATSVPAFAVSAVGSELDWKYQTQPEGMACLATGGICNWPRGKAVQTSRARMDSFAA
jgi:choline dehydrogenase